MAGGTGRNINYLIDGGDNNDDTVGGLVQNFPLDSIGEFNFQTQRFKAEYGRSYGGLLQVVTKSGTNELKGSVFSYFRDKSLNARTQSERNAEVEKGEYRKYQFGGSLGGPIIRDKTHFFLSVERLQQDTTQAVDTGGIFPEKDGVFDVPYRENIAVGKLTHQLNVDNYLSVRYGFNSNSAPFGASAQAPPEAWGEGKNTFHSANVNLNSVLGGGRLNEFVFQFSYFHNHISANSSLPREVFPGGVSVGQNGETPQDTVQKKLQFRDDFTWNRGAHEVKFGLGFINEPTLEFAFFSAREPSFGHLEDNRNSPIWGIIQNGFIGQSGTDANIPNEQYAAYVQDTWRVTGRLSVDVGVRYDLITGFANLEANNQITSDLNAAGRAGRLQGVIGLEDFGQEPREDKDNVAPRAGFTYDLSGAGRFVIRGGAGRYYDFAYTNATILFGVIGDKIAYGTIYLNGNSNGIRNPDGGFFRVGQPLPPNQLANVTRSIPITGSSPRIKQPYTDQVNLGLSRALGQDFAIEIDGSWNRGREQGMWLRTNVRISGGPRRFAGVLPNVGTADFTAVVSRGKSEYKGVSFTLKKRWDGKLQFLASYTLSEARSSAQAGNDEFFGFQVVDAFDPFSARQFGPGGTDARHRTTISAVWSPGWGVTIAPVFRYHTALPYTVTTGFDDNRDGVNFDLPADAPHVNQARGSDFSQLDVRVSKKFHLGGRVRAELIAEVFNAFNDTNPGGFVGNMRSSLFGQPTAFAGDFHAFEQRLAQLGVRLEF